MTRDQMIKYIQENYLTIPAKTMARILGKSSCFVRTVMKKNGCTLPEQTIEKFRKDSQLKPGHIPHCKGKKIEEFMNPEAAKRFRANQYGKGNLPHNTRPEGFISIHKLKNGYQYLYAKVDGKMRLMHRWVYELHYGALPKGVNVQFKDGNTLNVDPDNLYAIDRKNQAYINRNFSGNSLPQEYHETVKLLKQLKIRINEKQNHRPQ